MKYFFWWWFLMLVIGMIMRIELLVAVSVICVNMHYLADKIIKKIVDSK